LDIGYLKSDILVAKIYKCAVFVAKIYKHGLFIAEFCKQALSESFAMYSAVPKRLPTFATLDHYDVNLSTKDM